MSSRGPTSGLADRPAHVTRMRRQRPFDGCADNVVGRAQKPGPSHQRLRGVFDGSGDVGGRAAGRVRRHLRAATTTGHDQAGDLKLAVAASDRPDGQAQIGGQLSQRGQPRPRPQRTAADEIGQLTAQLLVGRCRVRGVDHQRRDAAHDRTG